MKLHGLCALSWEEAYVGVRCVLCLCWVHFPLVNWVAGRLVSFFGRLQLLPYNAYVLQLMAAVNTDYVNNSDSVLFSELALTFFDPLLN